MAQQPNNPFAEAFKALGDANVFSNAKFPAFDVNAVLTAQRRGAEALTAVNQAVTESMQAVLRHQIQAFQKNALEAFELVKEVTASPSPEATVEKQVAYTNAALQSALSNTRELAEIVSKSNIEVLDIIGKNIADNVGEISTLSKKKAA